MKMRKKHKALRIVLIVVIVIAALAAAALLWLRHGLEGGNYQSDEEVGIDEEAYETEPVNPEDIYHPETVTKATDAETEGMYTLLAIGGASPEVEEKAEDRKDADAIILLTFNSSMKTLYINTFNAKLYVHIPGQGPGSLGNSYAVGGGPLLCSTITENYGVPIDNYAIISLEDVAREMEMPEFEDIDVSEKGVEVIRELVSQLGISDPLEVASRITSLLPYITHNLSSSDLSALLLKMPTYVGYYSEDYMIPYEGTYQELEGYVVPDIEENSARLKRIIYQRPEEQETGIESESGM